MSFLRDRVIFEKEPIRIIFPPEGMDGKDGAQGAQGIPGTDGQDGQDGVGIASIVLLSTVGLNKTYRITLDNGSTFDFVVADGAPGPSVWGVITGTLTDQADLASALGSKANSADLGDLALLSSIDYTGNKITNKPSLGTMAALNDAPSDGSEYVRKNGAWSVATGGGGGTVAWGSITGTLSDQTDLGDLAGLDDIDYTSAKLTNKPTLGSLAAKSTVDYTTEVTNTPSLGTMSSVNDAPSDSAYYVRQNGAWVSLTALDNLGF